MIVNVKKTDCEHLKEMSYYNNNYYRLPFAVNFCDVLYNYYDGAEDFAGNSIGIIIDGKFVPSYWLHTDEEDYDLFRFDSDKIKDHNEWT